MTLTAAVPAFPVADIARALDFYGQVLGFALVHSEAGFAIVSQDGVELHLWLASDTSWSRRWRRKPVKSGAESFLSGTASCRLQCDDVEMLHRVYEAKGIVHSNGRLDDKPWGTREFSILDPDGNLITFYQPL